MGVTLKVGRVIVTVVVPTVTLPKKSEAVIVAVPGVPLLTKVSLKLKKGLLLLGLLSRYEVQVQLAKVPKLAGLILNTIELVALPLSPLIAEVPFGAMVWGLALTEIAPAASSGPLDCTKIQAQAINTKGKVLRIVDTHVFPRIIAFVPFCSLLEAKFRLEAV